MTSKKVHKIGPRRSVDTHKSIHTKMHHRLVERLRDARIEAGLTQTDVAEKLHRPQSYVSNLETGQQRIDVIELQTFVKMYDKTLDYFIGEGEGK